MARNNKLDTEPGNDAHVARAVENALKSSEFLGQPLAITGVNRRANLGYYEHLDIYSALVLPVTTIDALKDMEDLLKGTIEFGFSLVSAETYDRYALVKDAQQAAPGGQGS